MLEHVGNIYLYFPFVPRTFVGFLGGFRWIRLVVFLGSADWPRVELSFPPGRRNNALDPWGVVWGDVIGYKMEIVRWCSFLEDFLWDLWEFLSTIFWWRWNTPTRESEGNKHFSRWWQLNYFYFSPRSLGKWSNLTSIFLKWVGSTTN